MDTVVEFADRAACSYERVNKMSEFGLFARERIKCIVDNAILESAVVSHVAANASDGLNTEALMRVSERLGITI